MALDEEAKRRAVSAVAAVRDDIARVIASGSTGYDIFGQPRFNPDVAPEIPWVTRYRDAKEREALIKDIQGSRGDIDAPGE